MTSIAIIGTGFGGLAAAIELKRAGHTDITVFEKGDDVGGVWRENTYPGAACDIPSPYYSFSYAPNPVWPRRFSPQPAILDYLRGIADSYDVRRHIRFATEVAAADFHGATNTWTLETTAGERADFDVLISAVGQLSRPAWPNIAGKESFTGDSFHSAEWDHSVNLAGKRIAVIGTGASAIQFVPEIAPEAASLTLLQRTPPYLLPRPDTEFSSLHHKIFTKLPFTQKAERGSWFLGTEGLGIAFLYSKALSKVVETVSRLHMGHQTKGTDLFERIWPEYPVGCKRILFSSTYLPTLTRANVEVITDAIVEIDATGVLTADGTHHDIDVLIYGTGFTATDFLAPMRITGQGGLSLRQTWAAGARAYLGLSVPHFPNLFLMYGPNTNLGSGSIVFMLECQARYIRQALAHMPAGSSLVVRASVEEDYDEEIQARLTDGVWSQCANWYRLANGRIPTNWPGLVSEYRRRTATFDPSDYERTDAG